MLYTACDIIKTANKPNILKAYCESTRRMATANKTCVSGKN